MVAQKVSFLSKRKVSSHGRMLHAADVIELLLCDRKAPSALGVNMHQNSFFFSLALSILFRGDFVPDKLFSQCINIL